VGIFARTCFCRMVCSSWASDPGDLGVSCSRLPLSGFETENLSAGSGRTPKDCRRGPPATFLCCVNVSVWLRRVRTASDALRAASNARRGFAPVDAAIAPVPGCWPPLDCHMSRAEGGPLDCAGLGGAGGCLAPRGRRCSLPRTRRTGISRPACGSVIGLALPTTCGVLIARVLRTTVRSARVPVDGCWAHRAVCDGRGRELPALRGAGTSLKPWGPRLASGASPRPANDRAHFLFSQLFDPRPAAAHARPPTTRSPARRRRPARRVFAPCWSGASIGAGSRPALTALYVAYVAAAIVGLDLSRNSQRFRSAVCRYVRGSLRRTDRRRPAFGDTAPIVLTWRPAKTSVPPMRRRLDGAGHTASSTRSDRLPRSRQRTRSRRFSARRDRCVATPVRNSRRRRPPGRRSSAR